MKGFLTLIILSSIFLNTVISGFAKAPAKAPVRNGVIKVPGDVLKESATKKVNPPYPPIAMRVRAQGVVRIRVTVSEDGKVIDAKVVSGPPRLHEASLYAARQWEFKPTELSGKTVKVVGVLTFNFMLK